MEKVYHVDKYLEPMAAVPRETLLYRDGSSRTEVCGSVPTGSLRISEG